MIIKQAPLILLKISCYQININTLYVIKKIKSFSSNIRWKVYFSLQTIPRQSVRRLKNIMALKLTNTPSLQRSRQFGV